MTRRRLWPLALLGVGTAGVLSLTVVIGKKQASHLLRLQAAEVTGRVRGVLQEAVDAHTDGLDQLARDFGEIPPSTADEFKEMAVKAMSRGPAYVAVNRVDDRFIEKYLYPYAPNRALEGMDLKTRFDALPAAQRAISTRKPAASNLVPLAQGGEGFLIYAPVYRGDAWDGLMEGALRRDAFTARYLSPEIRGPHDATVLEESTGREVFSSLPRGAPRAVSPYDFYFTLRLADKVWWIILHPQAPPAVFGPLVFLMLMEIALAGAAAYRFLFSEGAGQKRDGERAPER